MVATTRTSPAHARRNALMLEARLKARERIDRAHAARVLDVRESAGAPTVLGEDSMRIAPGILRFTIKGTEHTLEPYLSGPENEQYFLIFRDGTSAVTTYGAGRYLYAAAAGEDGTTVLDFNLAYNPPCAFTPYATCPLPPPQNWLQASIEAGEMFTGESH